ncbi:hypothetical protein THAOC_18985 [Thalassiosira oceanica]|uniref:Uncharacterized protein n=1 Tax=Thalassiosira oceanica TaxID=159749 RepID=K0S5T9_THAOC|nr:hypothetical protein THAOC_18985 [Thalassiosira oceanica]|eukprot:EJK60625.1 hypothetical protein THAOC_18985 [Thalassiosira oceanica]
MGTQQTRRTTDRVGRRFGVSPVVDFVSLSRLHGQQSWATVDRGPPRGGADSHSSVKLTSLRKAKTKINHGHRSHRSGRNRRRLAGVLRRPLRSDPRVPGPPTVAFEGVLPCGRPDQPRARFHVRPAARRHGRARHGRAHGGDDMLRLLRVVYLEVRAVRKPTATSEKRRLQDTHDGAIDLRPGGLHDAVRLHGDRGRVRPERAFFGDQPLSHDRERVGRHGVDVGVPTHLPSAARVLLRPPVPRPHHLRLGILHELRAAVSYTRQIDRGREQQHEARHLHQA